MRNSLETRLGMFVALALVVTFIILETVGGLEIFKRGLRIAGLFDSVQELSVGAPVKMAGVPVGRVEKIDFAENRVRVVMKLNQGAPVKTDSRATIRFAGLMGQNFVSIDFGTNGAPVTDGAVLSTAEQPDFNTLVAKLDGVAGGVENLTKTFTGDKIDNLLGPLMGFMKDNREPLTATIANMKTFSGQLAEGKGTIGKLLSDDSLYNSATNAVGNLSLIGDELKLTLADARKVVTQANTLMANVNSGEGSIGKMFKDDTLYRETTASMTNLKEILQKVNKGDGTVGKLVNDPSLYKNANFTLQKVDKATESLEDQGVLTVLGIAVGRLF